MTNIALDVHAHLIPVFPDLLAEIEGVEWRDGKIWIDGLGVGISSLYEPERLIAWMDLNGVENALVSAPPPTYRAGLSAAAAESWAIYLDEGLFRICAGHPDRLIAFPHLPIEHPGVSAVIARQYAERSRFGFSIGPGGVSGVVLSDPAFDTLWQLLDDSSSFVMIHPGSCCDGRLAAFYLENLLGNPHETSVAAAHLVFANVPARFPNIQFCLAHGGGTVPVMAGRWQRGFDSDRPGVNKEFEAPLVSLRRFYADSILHSSAALTLSESVFGEDHIVFGSDWPFPMGLIEIDEQLSETSPTTLQRITHINPTKLLAAKKAN